MLEFYHDNISVCAQKVRLALEEKRIEWQGFLVDLFKGEQVSPEYLAINPRGVIPAIVHDGHPVIESTVILEYLDDAFPEMPLRPETALSRATMRVFTKAPDDGIHVACGTVSYAAAFAGQALEFRGRDSVEDKLAKLPDRARAARQKELLDKGMNASILPGYIRMFDKLFQEMEAALLDQPWLAGETFSLAECALLPYLWRLERLNLDAMWADKPNLAGWFARAKERQSWDTAMEAYPPLAPPGFDDDLKSKGVSHWPTVEAMLVA